MTMIPFSSLTVSAETALGRVEVGDFFVENGEIGKDFTYSNGVLTILSERNMNIGNIYSYIPTKDTVVVAKDISANLTFMGLNIDVSSLDDKNQCAFQIANDSKGDVTITLSYSNYLRSCNGYAGLQKNGGLDSGTLTIQGDGYLLATSNYAGAGIGGGDGLRKDSNHPNMSDGCNIHIKGGTIYAESINQGPDWAVIFLATGGAGIGGGIWGSGCNITISGGNVTAIGAEEAAGIGTGAPDSHTNGNESLYIEGECRNVSITGGVVTAKAGKYGSAIGGRMSSDKCSDNTISGGIVTLLRYTDIYIDENSNAGGFYSLGTDYKGGIVYEGKSGKVYSNYSLPANHDVSPGKTLTIPSSVTLTVPAGITLTNYGTINKQGNLVVKGAVKCDGHSFKNYVCTRCFNPCKHPEYQNGFCVDCGKTVEATLNSNGYYEIDNAGKLYWFAEKVNSDKTVNAILTDDIIVNKDIITANSKNVREWTPISSDIDGYKGVFDGNNHSISGLYFNNGDKDYIGFIKKLEATGVVKNLTIKNSYFFANRVVGGIVGYNKGKIENCHNLATISGNDTVGGITAWTTSEITKCSNSGKITSTNNISAGIVGRATEGTPSVSYCSNTGEIRGMDGVGGIVGFGYNTPITNCYSTGSVDFCENSDGTIGAIVAYNNSLYSSVNCYYLDTSCVGGCWGLNLKGSAESATIDQFKSGEITYRLNGTGEKVWCQTIGTDEIPQLKGDKVYYGYISCSSSAEKQYTNISTASDTKPNHTEGTPANCKDLSVCEICSEKYGKVNPDNHKSDETYSEYLDDTYHKNYYSCCNALMGTSYHSKGTEANCTTKNYCSDCKEYYGSTNAKNHTSEFIWVDNGNGTHIKKWPCCNAVENETKAHSFIFTADDEKNVITAHCKDCEHESSVSLVAPTGDLIYNGTWQDATIEGVIQGVEWYLENYKNGERFDGALRGAGKYKQVLTIGGKSISVEYEIKKRELTVESVSVAYKKFDGTRKIKVDDVYFDGLIGGDNVTVNCDNAYTYAPSCRAGEYETVSGLTGVTVEGYDMENYIIPEISENVEYSAYYSIYPYEVTITPKDQYITEASKLDKTAFTVDTELPEGYTLEGMAVALEGASIIVVDDSNAKVMYGDKDFTDCFCFDTYNTAIATICCEGHQVDENGFCSAGKCFAFESPELNNNGTPDEEYDDYYEIANAGQLYWYEQLVNVYGINYVPAKLVKDINIPLTASQGGNIPDWTPINALYAEFDGQGHSISGLYVDSDDMYVGFYGYSGYYPIKNLIITDSYFKGSYAVGAFAGYNQGEISNCGVTDTVTVTGEGSYVGALVGDNSNYITSSYALANSIAGYCGGYISNCYYIGTEEADSNNGTTAKSSEAFKNGEVAYRLQADIPKEDIYDDDGNYIGTITPHIWGQKIGVDAYPVIDGEKVYYGYKDCHATDMTYCNNKAYDKIPAHSYENGNCTICGDKDPDAKLVSITGDITLALEETDKDIFTGVIELEPDTYSFNLVDNGIIRGKNFTYLNSASIDYSAGYTAPTKLKATGGKYTFTYNASTLVLKIDYEPVKLPGDINGDGNISVSDVIFVMKHMVGKITLNEEQFLCADTDSNGRITIVDVLNIQKMVLEMV